MKDRVRSNANNGLENVVEDGMKNKTEAGERKIT